MTELTEADFAKAMLIGMAAIVDGNKILRNIKVVPLKKGGAHISYNASVDGSSARVILLKKGVRISNLKGNLVDINKTVGTMLHHYNNLKKKGYFA